MCANYAEAHDDDGGDGGDDDDVDVGGQLFALAVGSKQNEGLFWGKSGTAAAAGLCPRKKVISTKSSRVVRVHVQEH